MNKLEYIKDLSTGIETISYEKVNIAYPEHTHIHIRSACAGTQTYSSCRML